MQYYFFVFILTALPALTVCAESVCEFAPGSNLISGSDLADYRCIKLRATAGEEHWQYYLGLIDLGLVPGPQNIPEGLALLTEMAAHSTHYSSNSMSSIGVFYKNTKTSYKNYEISYQWFYLASDKNSEQAYERFYLASQMWSLKDGEKVFLHNENTNAAISPERRKELEHSAPNLLQHR
jgi:hypothetical protein